MRVAAYPDQESEDRAFVSEVAALESWPGHEVTARGTLREWAADLAAMGRAYCQSGASEADRLLDTIDTAAFQVAAAGTYCPEQLADLGRGVSLTGPLELVPVEPRCPDSPTGIDVQVTAFDNSYGADWTAIVSNETPYDALIRVDTRDETSGVADEYADFTDEYVGEWTVATEFADSMYEPFMLRAGETRTAQGGTMSTVYEWEEPSFRIENDFYLPLGCAVTEP